MAGGGYFGANHSPSKERKLLLQPSLLSSTSASSAAQNEYPTRDEEGARSSSKAKGKELLIDSDISKTIRAEEQELVKCADASADMACLDLLEQLLNGRKSLRQWDQFAANKKLYGVTSTYNENLYTASPVNKFFRVICIN